MTKLITPLASGGNDLFNMSAVQTLLISLAGLALLWIGIVVIGKSKRADYSETVKIGFNAVVGIVLCAAGAGALAVVAFGGRVLEFFGFGGGA